MKKVITVLSLSLILGLSLVGASAPMNVDNTCNIEAVNYTPADMDALGIGDGSVIKDLCNRACEAGREKCVAQDQGRGIIEGLCNKIFDACSAKCESIGG